MKKEKSKSSEAMCRKKHLSVQDEYDVCTLRYKGELIGEICDANPSASSGALYFRPQKATLYPRGFVFRAEPNVLSNFFLYKISEVKPFESKEACYKFIKAQLSDTIADKLFSKSKNC